MIALLELAQRAEPVHQQLAAAERDGLLDDERRRIADELQDHAAQTFFVIGLVARAALAELPPDRSSEPLAAALVQMGELATAGAKHLREAMFTLNHAEVDGRDVVPALWRLVRGFQQRTGIDADLVVTGREGRLPTDVAEALHAVGRVALANTERYGATSAVVLGLRFSPRRVTLSVQDDSTGAAQPSGKRIADGARHFGLQGVGERVRHLGGNFIAKPGRDGGFVVRARLPFKRGPLIAP